MVEAPLEQFAFLSCFFPAHDEESNIEGLLVEVAKVIPQIATSWEALVIDDGSTDDTARIVREFSSRHPEVRLIQHAKNLGYGHALRTGLKESVGNVIFFADADLQFRVSDLGSMVEPFQGSDVVIGYRIKREDPWHRRAIATVYHMVLKRMFDLHVRDIDCGFKLFDRRVVEAVVDRLESESAFISPELVIRAQLAGFRITEVGVNHYPRTAGTPGGATLKVIARTIRDMRKLRTTLRGRAA
jgi:glycosyltransferase involved in cell wall biosynthesis